MAHIDVHFTRNIEIGATREDPMDGLEVIETVPGKTVRNATTDTEPRRYEIAGYTCTSDNEDFISMRQMWRDTERGLHTFNFHDWIDDETVKVRFVTPMRITSEAGHLFHIDTFTIEEDLS
jgi:hypothetical protein